MSRPLRALFVCSLFALLLACGPGDPGDGDDEIGDADADTDGTDTATDAEDADTGILEECYELSQDSCPDDWPLLSCPGTDEICDTLSFDGEQGLDAAGAMTLECILTGLRDKTVGVYRVEDTFVEAPRSLYIQMLANGNVLIAQQSSNFGCVHTESVEGVAQDDTLQLCLDGGLDADAVETCLFQLGTGCAFYVGDPCG